MIILSIIGYILLFILIILAIIILIPYSYYAEVEKYDDMKIRGVVSWLFGGLKILILKEPDGKAKAKIRFLGFEKRLDLDKDKDDGTGKDGKNSKKKDKEKKKKSFNREYLKKKLIRKVLTVVKKLWKHLWPNVITARIKAGFDNPMYTGYMCALYSQSYILPKKYDIRMEPVFDEDILEGEGSVEGRIWIVYILVLALGLVVTKPFRKILFSKG
jgi:hypothetical protein